MEQVSQFTPFSVVPILRSYRVMHSSSCPCGIFPCNTSTTDWLRTSWSDDIENSIALISLLNIFEQFVVFYFLGLGVIPGLHAPQGGFDFYNPMGFIKLHVIISIHLPCQEVLEYRQKYASILHTQKFYWVRRANNIGHDGLVLVQFNLVDMYFYSK